MSTIRFVIGLAASLVAVQVHSSPAWPGAEDWANADLATIRLEPAAFPDLPPPVRAALTRRACTIPQTFSGGDPHNVLKGRLTSRRATDWAVLCSRGRMSSVLVFSGESPSEVMELARGADADFLQVIGPRKIGYARVLRLASPQHIRQRHRDGAGAEPPPPDHDGIEDTFIEKASVVWYWHAGRWSQRAGAD